MNQKTHILQVYLGFQSIKVFWILALKSKQKNFLKSIKINVKAILSQMNWLNSLNLLIAILMVALNKYSK